MQFNPIFINDIVGTQTPKNANDKSPKNKYLFSDIIKVVMDKNNSEKILKKLPLEKQIKNAEIIGGNFIQLMEKLKNIKISDAENKTIKIQLADILPEEMAKLLTGKNTNTNNNQIISYVGKDKMQGELKKFLTDLVGEKIFKKHVTNKSGVFVKLEDEKSSVNIEIIKEAVNNSKTNKTVIHAMVVPQKSKLQIIAEHNKFPDTIKTSNFDVSHTVDISDNKINNSQTSKPTLSVYSFKVENNSNKTDLFIPDKSEMSVEKNKTNIKHLPEIQTEKTFTTVSKNTRENLSEISKNNLKEDFNISKITIIKKSNTAPTLNLKNKIAEIKTDEKIKLSENKITTQNSNQVENHNTANNKEKETSVKIVKDKTIKVKKKTKTTKENEKTKIKKEEKNTDKKIEKNSIRKNIIYDKTAKEIFKQKRTKHKSELPPKNKTEKGKQNYNQIINNETTKNVVPNKKISVKIKKAVKSIASQKDEQKNISSGIKSEQKENTKQNDLNLNNFGDTQSNNHKEKEITTKKKIDSAFNRIISKEHNHKTSKTHSAQHEMVQKNTNRIVKSVEVIKELSKFILKQKKGSLSFTIKPEHLGQLKITLETHNHIMNAHIQVENDQAKFLVEKNLNELHTQLQKNGVELNSLNISLGYSSKHKNAYRKGNTKQQKEFTENAKEEINAQTDTKKALGYNTYEYLA